MKQILPIITLTILSGLVSSIAIAEDETPGLEIRYEGGSSVWLTLTGVADDDNWILQDSYDGIRWRDIRVYSGTPVRETRSRRPNRLFRAAMKPLISSQEALNNAKEQWETLGLSAYQFQSSSGGGELGFIEQMASAKNGQVFEYYNILSPDFWEPGKPLSIERVFTRIQGAIDLEAETLFVLYHPEWGYPESVYIDYSLLIADEEWSWTLTAPPRTLDAVVDRASKAWNQSGHPDKNYRYHLRFETAWGNWEGDIEVIDGLAKVLNGSEPTWPHIIRPMESYFTSLQESIANESDVAALFDPINGVPVFLSIDWLLTAIDGPGERYWITEFEILE